MIGILGFKIKMGLASLASACGPKVVQEMGTILDQVKDFGSSKLPFKACRNLRDYEKVFTAKSGVLDSSSGDVQMEKPTWATPWYTILRPRSANLN